MKECKYCGSKYDDELLSCPSCGASLTVTEGELAEEQAFLQKEKENRERAISEVKTNGKGLMRRLLIIILTLIVLCIGIPYTLNNVALNGGLSKAAMEECYERGKQCYEAGNYRDAIVELGKVSAGKYADSALSIKVEATEFYREDLIERADAFADQADYENACAIIDEGLEIVPDDSFLLEKAEQYKVGYITQIKNDVIPSAENADNADEYVIAINSLRKMLSEIGSDAEAEVLLAKCEESYSALILNQAESVYQIDGYQAAIEVVENALTILPDSQVLQQAIVDYDGKKPVWLSSVDYFDRCDSIWRGSWTTDATVKDNLGNEHIHSLNLEHLGTTVSYDYISYYIDGLYSRLKGTFMRKYDYRSSSDETTLYIYGDDCILWEGTVSSGSIPLDIDVNICGVNILKFEVEGSGSDIAIGEVQLFP